MKWFRRIALAVALLVAAAGLFYWFMPASVAVPFLAARTHGLVFGDVSGSLWDGRAARVATADGRELGTLNWQLGRGVILGRLRLDFHLEGRAGRVEGHIERGDGDRMTWTGFDFRLDAAALAGPALSAELVPMGVVEGRIPHAEWQGNWPLALNAAIDWRKAAVRTPEGHVALGDIGIKARSDDGVLRATVADDGTGSLATDAALAASPLGWRMQGRLVPRVADTALSHLIARFGPMGRDGTVNLQRKAGLAPTINP